LGPSFRLAFPLKIENPIAVGASNDLIILLDLDEHLGRDVYKTTLAGFLFHIHHTHSLPLLLECIVEFV
jgi:hypothetical protein